MGLAFVPIVLVSLAVSPGAQSKLDLETKLESRLELGSDVTIVGQEARVGITLNTAGEHIAAIEDDVLFPAALSFVQGELGDAAKSISAKLETELAEASDTAGLRRLHVKITAPEGALLPTGTMAVLRFKAPVSLEGDSTDFKLSHRGSVTVDGRAGALPLPESGGLVTVLKKPAEVIACFFYMH